MKFSCFRCQQKIEADEATAGQAFACPTCGQPLVVPSPPSVNALAKPLALMQSARPTLVPAGGGSPTRPPLFRPAFPPPAVATPPRRPAGLGFAGWLLCMAVLLAGGCGYAMYHFQESPWQLWQRLLKTAQSSEASLPPPVVSAPTPEPTVAATSLPADSNDSTPPPPAATSPPDPLAWILEHRAYQPRIVSLTFTTIFPIPVEGAPAGSGAVPVGSLLKLLSIDPKARTVRVAYAGYHNSIQDVPVASTDLLPRLRAAMVQADADAESKEAAQAAMTPAPSADDSTAVLAGDPQGLLKADATGGAFVHPGLLHSEEDFQRMRSHLGREPWKAGWERLVANPHASLGYHPRPVEAVVRGRDRLHTDPENYRLLFNDIAAAYACALRWRISGDQRYAEKSVEIMNAWSSTLKELKGSTDSELAAGIYGSEFANAAEIMRTYKGWKPEDFARFKTMMKTVFLPGNQYFLTHHNNAPLNHYWANWDLCNMDSLLAIGVLCDDRALYNEAVNYFKNGGGMGSIKNAVNFMHPGGLGQWQESGRDQGHTTLGVSLMGAFCEMAWKQGDDLYGYDHDRFLAGCEYIAKYNLGEDVPFQPYKNDKWEQTTISDNARGLLRPAWELVYNHYAVLKGLPAPYTTRMAVKARPEGGGGDYGPNSGGYDQLGYGTLTATLDPHELPAKMASAH